MTLLTYYQNQCTQGAIVADEQQLQVLCHMQKLADELLLEHKKRVRLGKLFRKPKSVKGLYLWGGVGIGKTFLMDCFYQHISFSEKKRIHFHEFMRWLHSELRNHQGEKEPLQIIAKTIARKVMLLCFDEFFVSDIADAMLLARFIKPLLAHGVCIVMTSNVVPDDLYKNGLQRQLFLPAIAMLKQHTKVIHVSTDVDYRMRHLKNAGVFHTPIDETSHANMEKTFAILTQHTSATYDAIEICDRPIQITKQAGDVIWFDFDVICNSPRSQHDYLAIAEKYKTVFISNIPIIPSHARDRISLFIKLVDVFYDARIRLIFSAEDVIEKIYASGNLIFEYARTRSRLIEMQSESYFAA